MKIIIFIPGPHTRKARVTLSEKDIGFEEIIDVLWNTDTLTQGITPWEKFQYFYMRTKKLFLIVG